MDFLLMKNQAITENCSDYVERILGLGQGVDEQGHGSKRR